MPPADNDPIAPTPDGKKPSLGKRFLDQVKSPKPTKSSSASSTPTTRSMEIRTAPSAADEKPSLPKRLLAPFKGSKFIKRSSAPSTPAAQSAENLATHGASATQPAANVLGLVTALAAPGASANAQVVTVTGLTSAMNVNQRGPATAVPNVSISQNDSAMNPVSFDQSAQPGPDVPQAQRKFKRGVNVALDGCLTALRLAKEASDWNPFLKATLGGVMAAIDLAKTVSDNSEDMKGTVAHIQGLLPILETSAKRLEARKDDFGKGNDLMTFAITMQAELEKIQEMQSHGLFKRVLQGPKDATTLLGIYKNISESLEQFKETCLAEALEMDSELAHTTLDIQLIQMLIQPWEASASERLGLPPLIIVVDALDENQSGSVFLKHLLHAVGATRLRGLKFFVTSREDEQISRLCNTLPQGTVLHLQNIQKQTVQNDIGLYLSKSLPDIHSQLLEKLTKLSDGLFIYAATVVKMVTVNDAAMDEQVGLLQKIIDQLSNSVQLGDLYFQIVKDAISHPDKDFQTSRLQVLHTILCAMHPISDTVVAQLAKTTVGVVALVLKKLHAVMYKSQDGMIYTYHASFADYILQAPTDAETAFDPRCDAHMHHAFLAKRCYKIMEMQLCFNICGLESSFVKDADVQGLQKCIEDKIDNSLKYAVLKWMAHLNSTSDPEETLQMKPQQFVEELLLFWMEVVNLLNAKREGMQMLDMLTAWIDKYTPNTLGGWKEALKFSQSFFSGSASPYTPHFIVHDVGLSPDRKQVVSAGEDKSVCIWDALTGDIVNELNGHTDRVLSVAFSPDGKQVVSGSADQSVHIWDVLTGDLVKQLNGHTDQVQSVAFSPDGKQVVSGSNDQSVHIWDVLTGDLVKELNGHTDQVWSVAFSPDGKQVVSGSADQSVCIWDSLTGDLVKELNGHTDQVWSVAFSPDGKQVVSGSRDRSVHIWDALTGDLVNELNGHTNWVWSVSFSPDGKQVVSGMHIWDALTGDLVKELNGHTGWVTSVEFSSDGKQVVSGSGDQSVRIWDALTGDLAKELNEHTGMVLSVAFSPDGKHVVSGSADQSVHIWDALTGDLVKELNGHTNWIWSVAFSPDGKQVVSGSVDRSVCIWDALTGDLVNELNGHTNWVWSVAFSPDGKQVVSGSGDRSMCIWDALTGDLVKELNGHTDRVASVAFSPDGKHVVSGSGDQSVCIWDALTGDLVKELNGHTDQVWSVAFSPDGKQVVSGSGDQSVCIWEALTGDLVKELNGHTDWVWSVAFSPDGRCVVSGGADQSVCIWDVLTGGLVKELNGHTGWVESVAFSPDGKQVVSGSVDQSVRIWDASTGDLVKELNGHTDQVPSLAFSSDGKQVVSGSGDKSVHIWDALTGDLVKELKEQSLAGSSDESFILKTIGSVSHFHQWSFNPHTDVLGTLYAQH
ncbi:hypothetical protein DXG01_007492 [Tephrocybe rancida]|nr:hypothetical protein DXG01_007492 [Tephrocybe rancida]